MNINGVEVKCMDFNTEQKAWEWIVGTFGNPKEHQYDPLSFKGIFQDLNIECEYEFIKLTTWVNERDLKRLFSVFGTPIITPHSSRENRFIIKYVIQSEAVNAAACLKKMQEECERQMIEDLYDDSD